MKTQRCVVLLVAAGAVALAAPATAAPPQPAGPKVSYADAADDGYRTPFGPALLPDPLQSEPTLDIREVAFEPARKSTYVASMTFSGEPTAGSTYISAGYFQGKDCQMYHFLPLGRRAYANLFCGSGEEQRYLGAVHGDWTQAAGNTVYASFSNRWLPPELETADSTLTGLFSWSCPAAATGGGNLCRNGDKVDVAQDLDASYQLRAPAS